MQAMISVLALLMPIALPVATLVLTSRLRLWWRAGLVLVASLASLPIGVFLALVGHQPDFFTAEYSSPAVGIVAVPVILLWAASFFAALVWMVVVGISTLRAL